MTTEVLAAGESRPRFSHRIGPRLIASIIGFSSVITLVITALQLVADYHQQRDSLDTQLDQIAVFLPTITDSVWNFDEYQINLTLAALAKLPDIKGVSIVTADRKQRWEQWQGGSKRPLTREYALERRVLDATRRIATLEVTASLDGIYHRLIDRAIGVLVSNTVKTFLVATFMFLIFRRLVTHRLETLARDIRALAPKLCVAPESLPDRPEAFANGEDEIEVLRLTYERMARRIQKDVEELRQAANNLQAAHGRLQDEMLAREKAMADIQQFNATLEARVQERTAELESANRNLEAFSYSISHDLRAPLRAISGFSSILVKDQTEQLSPSGRDLLERIARAAARLAQLIDDVLDYSRAGRATAVFSEFDLGDIARDLIKDLSEQYPATQFRLGALPRVCGDPAMMQRVLDNLLTNACKFSAKRADPVVEIGVGQQGGETVFFVKDNGVGFDMRHAGKLFGLFQRLHSDTEFTGTGAGLSIARLLIERQRGRIWAESELDHGACFYFTLGG